MSSLFGRLSGIHYMYPLKTKEEEEINTKGLIEDTVVISSSEDGMVHCIFDFVHGYLSNCKVQAPVVQTSDSAIHRINHYPADSVLLISVILIRCIVIYPVDSAIQRLNNRGQLFAGQKQCLHSSGVRELLSNVDGNSN